MTTLLLSPSAGATARRAPASNRAVPRRPLTGTGEPLFLADWDEVLMIHYEVDPAELAPFVPFPLDLHEGRAFVSLVAFNMRHARLARGGWLGRWLGGLFANHGFLNVRTYVVVDGRPGIHFLTEHMDSRLSRPLGPVLFGLPYRLARISYRHDWRGGRIEGCVADPRHDAAFSYRALVESAPAGYRAPERGSLTEWLMERYIAYTARGARRRLFHVAHNPWPAAAAAVRVGEDSLLRGRWPWFPGARLAGAHFSPGVSDVAMGYPRKIVSVS